MRISKSFKRFQCFNFETNFLENGNIFQKPGEPGFLVETTKIENTSFPLKTARSETNVKTNRMRLQIGPITKSGVLPVNTLFFWKICFSFRTSLIELI